MKKLTVFFDADHTIAVDLDDNQVEAFIDWFYGSETIYKLDTSVRTYYISKSHIRHINIVN